MRRFILDVAFFSSILFLPWWVSVILGVVLLFTFTAYEVLLGGVFLDLLYGTPAERFLQFEFVYTVLFALLFTGVYFLKRELKFY